ncbi:MAG: hypothetical protein AB7O55_20410, partial [Lautropia sp.]
MLSNLLNPRLLPYLLTLVFVGAGAVAGLVVATGNVVMIALVVGAIAGILLLNAPAAAVWVLLFGIMLVNGPVGFFTPALARIVWLFSLLGIFVAGMALLYSAVGRSRPNRPMPAFVWLALVFAIMAGVCALFSNGSLAEIAAGAKRQFQFWGLVLLLALVPFKWTTVRYWMLFLFGVALVQVVPALYQRVVLVPQVMGFEMPGFVAFDIVVGTFEGSLYGGGSSAVMAMYLVIAGVGTLAALGERLIGPVRCLVLLAAIFAPLALGETKVVLAMVPTVLLCAYYDAIAKRPLAFLGAAVLTLMIAAVLAYVYFLVQVTGDLNWRDNLEQTFAYNFGERGYYGTGVNRLTAVPYWFQQQSWAEPLRALFGYGVGSSYGVDGRAPLPGHMFTAHAGMYIDLVAASLLLWDYGFVGASLFLAVLLGAAVTAARCLREAVTPWDRTLCRVLLGSLGASAIMLFYSASMVVTVSHSFLLAIMLGLIAWRARHGPLVGAAAERTAPRRPRRAPAWATPLPPVQSAFAAVPPGAGATPAAGYGGAFANTPFTAGDTLPGDPSARDWSAPPPRRERPAPTARGPVERGPIERGPIERGPIERGPIERGPIERGPIER